MGHATDDNLAAAYAEKGYAILPAAFGPETCAAAIDAIEGVQRRADSLPREVATKLLVFERDLPAAKRNGVPPEATGNAIFIIGDPPSLDRRFAALALDEAILAPVRRLLGTAAISLHFSNVTMKRGRIGSGISWHRDFPNKFICPAAPSFLRVMLCLDGMDGENGATRFRPGSHRAAAAAVAPRDQAGPIKDAFCPPGSLVFIHPLVLHDGPPNAAARHRRNVVMQWGRADDPPAASPEARETLTDFAPEDIRAWLAAAHADESGDYQSGEAGRSP